MSQDFGKSKIYKITNDYNDDVYVGSTCDLLTKRFSKHKGDSKNEKKIQNLTFSPGWICKFIAMNDMTRRRSTAQGDKEINTNDKINLELQKAHDKINEEVIKQIKDNSVL